MRVRKVSAGGHPDLIARDGGAESRSQFAKGVGPTRAVERPAGGDLGIDVVDRLPGCGQRRDQDAAEGGEERLGSVHRGDLLRNRAGVILL